MTHDQTIDWDQLDRFARRAGSPDELVLLAAWVDSDLAGHGSCESKARRRGRREN